MPVLSLLRGGSFEAVAAHFFHFLHISTLSRKMTFLVARSTKIRARQLPEFRSPKNLSCFECGSPPKRATPHRSAPLGLMHGRRTYAHVPDLCTGAGLMHGHRTSARVPGYVQEPELCTDARPVHRAQHLRRRAGLMQRHWFYADPPDLCRRAGLMRRPDLMHGRQACAWAPALCVGAGLMHLCVG